MSGVYLTELADWFRAAGLTVVEWQGWATRARSSGGYADASRPWCVMWHHTASPPTTSPEDLARYTAETGDNAPIANVNVERDGSVWLLAAGPTNTNGKGNPMTFTKGRVPQDSMNSYAFGMEIVNDGVGEPYPQVQIDAAFVVSAVVNARLGNAADDVATHWSYAPTRKIDPAVNAVVQGPWQPGSCTTSGTWDLDDLRAECRRRATHPAPQEGESVLVYVEVSDAWARFIGTAQLDPLIIWQVGYTSGSRADVHSGNLPHVTVSKAQLSGCSLFGKDPPPADDGGGPAQWDPDRDFHEWVR